MEDGKRARRPTAEELIAKLKDDGDFDTLRLKIIRKVKENEELRNNIIMEVKQSEILNQDGSENLKPKQLSDAIYQELGKKIMGQISDEVWKVIRNESTKDDIRETIESVYDRIVNPKPREEDQPSSKDNPIKQNGASIAPPLAAEANMADGNEHPMPAPPNQQGNKTEQKEAHHQQLPHLPLDNGVNNPTNMVDDDDDDMPPGFAMPVKSAGTASLSPAIDMIGSGDVADLPPGFDAGGCAEMFPGFRPNSACSGGAFPPVFSASVAGIDDDDDDPDVPPGFG